MKRTLTGAGDFSGTRPVRCMGLEFLPPFAYHLESRGFDFGLIKVLGWTL